MNLTHKERNDDLGFYIIINQIKVMTDYQRSKLVLNTLCKTLKSAKRQEKRRLSSISYYSHTKDKNFGSLFQLLRFWERQVKNKKSPQEATLLRKQKLSKSQPAHQFELLEEKLKQNQQQSQALRNNDFRVRFSSQTEKYKFNRVRKIKRPKIEQLNVISKTINYRNEKIEKQSEVLCRSNQRWTAFRDPKSSKTTRLQKEVFEDDFKLTPW